MKALSTSSVYPNTDLSRGHNLTSTSCLHTLPSSFFLLTTYSLPASSVKIIFSALVNRLVIMALVHTISPLLFTNVSTPSSKLKRNSLHTVFTLLSSLHSTQSHKCSPLLSTFGLLLRIARTHDRFGSVDNPQVV